MRCTDLQAPSTAPFFSSFKMRSPGQQNLRMHLLPLHGRKAWGLHVVSQASEVRHGCERQYVPLHYESPAPTSSRQKLRAIPLSPTRHPDGRLPARQAAVQLSPLVAYCLREMLGRLGGWRLLLKPRRLCCTFGSCHFYVNSCWCVSLCI